MYKQKVIFSVNLIEMSALISERSFFGILNSQSVKTALFGSCQIRIQFGDIDISVAVCDIDFSVIIEQK